MKCELCRRELRNNMVIVCKKYFCKSCGEQIASIMANEKADGIKITY